MFPEELGNPLVFGLAEPVPVAGAFHEVEVGIDAGFLQGLVQHLTLLPGNQRVLVAMNQQERRIIF